MTPGSVEGGTRAVIPPLLVLGLGNPLLGDDGVGLRLLELLAADAPRRWGEAVELLDGGTQGLALLGRIAGRSALVLLDAVALGAAAGTIHVLDSGTALGLGYRSTTAHEGNAGELLKAALLLGDLPPEVAVVGIEPLQMRTGIGLTEVVEAALPEGARRARDVIDDALTHFPAVGAEQR